MDMKKLLSIVDNSGTKQKTVITESVATPVTKNVSTTERYFKAVNNEVLKNIKEEQAQKKAEVKKIVNRVLEKLDEGKTNKQEAPKPRNFVAKNATTSGAGAHKDKKKAEKQGDVKHKKQAVPLDEISLGDYRTKANKDRALSGMSAAFGRSPEERAMYKARAERRNKGLERVKARDDKARKSEQEKQLASLVARLPELKAEYEEMQARYKSLGGSNWQYADREQNLSDREREARSMEGPMNNLWRQIQAAEKAQGLSENRLDEKCWDTHKQVGMKKKGSRMVPNCVPKESKDLKENGYGNLSVGSPVKVYSNVLKKAVFGKVVKLDETRAYVQYKNTKIVMSHPIETIQLHEAGAGTAANVAAKAAPGIIGKTAARALPGVGLAVGAYDAYDRAKKGDYVGAGLSALGGVTSLLPGVGTAATMGITGAQLARDYKMKTGAFAPDDANKPTPGQAATPAAGGKWPATKDEIIAFQKANKDKDGKPLVADGLIGAKTYQAMIKAGMKPPANFAVASYKPQQAAPTQAATPAPAGATGASVGGAAAPASASTGTTTNTSSSSQVSGTLKMGKADGPIQFNGKTVNPGDPNYAAAEQALLKAQQSSQQARARMSQPKGAVQTAPVQQGASQELDRDF